MDMTRVENFRLNLIYALTPYGAKAKCARNAGITITSLGAILRGDSSPTLMTALNLADAAGYPIEDLTLSPPAFKRKYPEPGQLPNGKGGAVAASK